MTRAFANVVAPVLLLGLLAGTASAIEQPCPSGKIWDLNRGACVPKKKKVKKQSAEEKYYAALDHLSGEGKNPDPRKAPKLLEDACGKKFAAACTQLGFMHLRGRGGLTPSAASAIGFYEKSCSLGDHDGCIGAAEIYGAGSLGEIDHAKAIPLLDKACAAKAGRACYHLAQKYDYALGVAADGPKATALYQKSFGLMRSECDGGLGASCDLVGQMQQYGYGTAVDLAGALADYTKGCQANSGDACYDLGWVTEKGIGAAADPIAAYAIYEKGCRIYDHVDACFQAGALLALDTVPYDKAVLEPYAIKACTLSLYRCDLLGFIKAYGIGTAVDLTASAQHYDDACTQGNGVACRVMGEKYRDAFGVTADSPLAATYLEKACDLQEALGCTEAGKLHYRGDTASGLSVDQARAFALFDLGCVRKEHEACQWAGEIVADGTDGTGKPDPRRAILYFEEGCLQGRGNSCWWAGDLYLDGRATGAADPTTAVQYYSSACWAAQFPQTGACHAAAGMWRDGNGVPKDPLSAAQAMVRSCAIGGGQDCITADGYLKEARAGADDKQALIDAIVLGCEGEPPIMDSCMAWSLLQDDGSYAVPRNAGQAMQRFDDACNRGWAYACYLRAEAFRYGVGPTPDQDVAIADYRRSCEAGYHDGCVQLGYLLQTTGKAAEALRLYQVSCDEGSGSACNMLGFSYYTASGVRWDITEAVKLYEQGCELGDSIACSNNAEMYEWGIAREPDAAKAYELFTKACEMGFQGGCARAARFVEAGTGGATKDLDAAAAAYEAACNVDIPDACRDLAELHEARGSASASSIAQLNQKAFDLAKQQGETNPFYLWMLGTYHRDGVATMKDPTKAGELFVEACEGYDPLGCLDAGRLYATGDVGLDANVELAAAQYTKACAAGVEEACRLKAELSAKKVPLTKNKGGCACRASGGGGGAIVWVIVVSVLAVRPRRRRRAATTR